MKKVLDFSKVPLDKWVDLYIWCDKKIVSTSHQYFSKDFLSLFNDVAKFAEVDIMEESDYNREIVEALLQDQHTILPTILPESISTLMQKRNEALSGEKEKDQK